MNRTTLRPLVASGMMLGIGMGGFLDGIVVHQILQLHNMLSAKYPPTSLVNVEVNMFWDGLFHLLTWVVTAAGLVMLWRTVRRTDVILSGRALLSAAAVGWGLFNFVEGIINHYILELHHVRELSGRSIWDAAFVASGLILIAIGILLLRSEIAIKRHEGQTGPSADGR